MDRANSLRRGQRALLAFCSIMNLMGAICFVPAFATGRRMLGLPEAPPIYLAMLAAWVLIFGLGYLRLSLTGRMDRTFLWAAAAGKATFGVLIVSAAVSDDAINPWALGSGAMDFGLACVFAEWLFGKRETYQMEG